MKPMMRGEEVLSTLVKGLEEVFGERVRTLSRHPDHLSVDVVQNWNPWEIRSDYSISFSFTASRDVFSEETCEIRLDPSIRNSTGPVSVDARNLARINHVLTRSGVEWVVSNPSLLGCKNAQELHLRARRTMLMAEMVLHVERVMGDLTASHDIGILDSYYDAPDILFESMYNRSSRRWSVRTVVRDRKHGVTQIGLSDSEGDLREAVMECFQANTPLDETYSKLCADVLFNQSPEGVPLTDKKAAEVVEKSLKSTLSTILRQSKHLLFGPVHNMSLSDFASRLEQDTQQGSP